MSTLPVVRRPSQGIAETEPTAADWAEFFRWSAGELEGDPSSWPAWTDADRWEPTDAERAEAAAILNADATDYCLVDDVPPSAGLADDLLEALHELELIDRAAAEAEMQDRMEAGIIGW